MGTDHVTGKLALGADPRRVKSEPSGRADLGQHKQLERGGSDQGTGDYDRQGGLRFPIRQNHSLLRVARD